MQDAPNLQQLLTVLASFLDEEVRPAIKDPRLAFRVRIASHLCTSAIREVTSEEADDAATLSGLNVFFADEPSASPATREERGARMHTLTEKLVARIRKGDLTRGERSHLTRHVKDTLRQKLAVNSPGFDLSRDLPGDGFESTNTVATGEMSK